MKEIYRKIVHLGLSSLLICPFILHLPEPLDIRVYYSLGLLAAALINSAVVRRSKLRVELENFSSELHKFVDSFGEKTRMPLAVIEEAIDEFHGFIERQLSLLERDYEKREGYVGLLYGMIGAVISLLVDPCHTFYGITALAVVDTVASISSMAIWHRGKSLGGEAVAFLVYASLLVVSGSSALQAIVVSLLAVVSEYFSPEDNLTVPVVATTTAMLLGAPPHCPL
ncbi:hypothetical protein IG193_03660 [Infirmifilum lucidum]|uniref:Dolichol kinase n=2 Tax=Infirmifilum lucidum TaxID=2776706 RepID=A0A7L9FKU2_9CREN|nr:hypothetical protein IG193_03660 [Infirmifilum lucidum]